MGKVPVGKTGAVREGELGRKELVALLVKQIWLTEMTEAGRMVDW